MAKNKLIHEGALDHTARSKINENLGDVSRCTTQLDAASSTTLANVTGMVTDSLEAGTYRFVIHLATTATSNGGIKAGLKFGTASMLTSIESTARAFTASSVVVQHSTTATDAASLIASTTAIINLEIEGVLVVAIPGTLQLQMAQNVSHADTSSVYVNSYMVFTKIG